MLEVCEGECKIKMGESKTWLKQYLVKLGEIINTITKLDETFVFIY